MTLGKLLISFFYHFANEIDLAFKEFVSKPFVDEEQVNPHEPCDEPFLLLWHLQTFKILNQIRHPVEKHLLPMSAGYVSQAADNEEFATSSRSPKRVGFPHGSGNRRLTAE